MQGCKFLFNIYPNGGMRSNPFEHCGQSSWYQSERNVMVVTLTGPAYIPEGTFNCQFEATNNCGCGWKNPVRIQQVKNI